MRSEGRVSTTDASHVPDMEPGEKQIWQQQTCNLLRRAGERPGGSVPGWAEVLAGGAACVLLVPAESSRIELAPDGQDRGQLRTRGARRFAAADSCVGLVDLDVGVIEADMGIGVAYAGTKDDSAPASR